MRPLQVPQSAWVQVWRPACTFSHVFWTDIRYAARTLARTPAFTITVLLSLALGIGSNAAIFSVVNALFLHPAGINRPERVVVPCITYKKLHLDRIGMSMPDFADVRQGKEVFKTAAAVSPGNFNLTSGDVPQRVRGAAVTWQWFDVFESRPFVGRSFHKEEDEPGANQVVMLSFDLWKRLFGSDRSVVGRTIDLNRKQYRVVGVMPENFRWPSDADVWVPLGLPQKAYAATERFNEFYTVVARLQDGVSYAQSQRFMSVLTERAKSANKEVGQFARDSQWSMGVETFPELTSGDLKKPLFLLAASVGVVLLIACSNIAGLMLVRASARVRELAVRSALGASARNLLGQALAESVLLSLGGTVLGLMSVSVLLKGLLVLAPARITAGLVIQPDRYVTLLSIGAGALSALLFGTLPAWQAIRFGSRYEALKEGGRSDTESGQRQRLRSALVVGQVALAFVLLLGAGLLLKSLDHLRTSNLGFNPSRLMTTAVELPDAAYHDESKQAAFFRSVLERLRDKPGVVTAAAAEPVPFGGNGGTGSFEIEGQPARPGEPGPHGYRGFISPSYFKALHMPLLAGRDFNDADRTGSQPVTIVDENLARRYWPNASPIGQRLRNGKNSPWTTVVGVVRHVRAYNFDPADLRGIYYRPVYQEPVSSLNLIVKTSGDPQWAAAVIARTVRESDPALPTFDVATMTERIAKALGPQQFAVELLSLFGTIAAGLAAIGLYGVISFSASRRTREIGIRSALGAGRWQILTMIGGQGVRLALVGLLTGTVVVIFGAQLISRNFVDASLDFETASRAALVLAAVAALAALWPAWRATRIDPVRALRND